MVIATSVILLFAEVTTHSEVGVYMYSTLFTNLSTHECILGHQNIGVCEISDTYLLRCLRYEENHGKDLKRHLGDFICKNQHQKLNQRLLDKERDQSLKSLMTASTSTNTHAHTHTHTHTNTHRTNTSVLRFNTDLWCPFDYMMACYTIKYIASILFISCSL